MPVQGLSDRASLDPRFKEIGRIRKGAPKPQSGKQPGRDLDHFRYVPDSQHQESAAVFEKIYGKEPTELEVRFPFDQMERVFGSWREEYGKNRLCKLRCDGARWHDWIDGDQHHHSEAGQECTRSFRDTKARCPMCPLQYVGRLSVMLEPMWYAGQIGIVTVITSSVNDIANLSAKLVQWEPLTGKPFRLWRETERIGVPIKGKRAGKDSDLLHLELTENQLKLEFKAMERRAMARLEAPPIVTVAQIEAEYHGDPVQLADVVAYTPSAGPYEDEALTGDPFLNGDFHGAPKAADLEPATVATPKPPILGLPADTDLDYTPEWLDDDTPRQWGKLYFEARKLGFTSDFHVKGALKHLFPSDDDKAETWKEEAYRTVWCMLQEHQRSKVGEAQ